MTYFKQNPYNVDPYRGSIRKTQPDPDALRLRWVEQKFDDQPDTTDWRDEWVDTLDHFDR